MKTSKKVIRCASCKKRIRPHEPDLVLEDVAGQSSLGSGKPRYYHERCQSAARRLAMEQPSVYRLTVRHVDSSRN